jgi:uncharacterized damage-inducible protein DinB
MTRADHIRQMANYNQWMNAKLFDAARTLSDEELAADKGAFFHSIIGTLNHIAVGDTLWLKRFVHHPANYAVREAVQNLPNATSLDQLLHADMQGLSGHRKTLDQIIVDWAQSVNEEDLDHVLQYVTTKNIAMHKNFFSIIMHFFNHQTHHRGQVTTLLSQAGVDVGTTDLMVLIPNEDVA